MNPKSIHSAPPPIRLYRSLLCLATMPVLSGAVLLGLMVRLADAAPAAVTPATCNAPASLSFDRPSVSLAPLSDRSLIASSRGPTDATLEDPIESIEYPMMDFTAAESDAAVALFGCDCLPCINALRQLRNQSLTQLMQPSTQQASNQGHCWSSLQRRHSPQEIEDVLQQLEAIGVSS
jgi:hypothetical protein